MAKNALVQARLRLQRFKCPSQATQDYAQTLADQSSDVESSSICQDSTQTQVKLTYTTVRLRKRQRVHAPDEEDGEIDTWQHADILKRPRLSATSSCNPHTGPIISNGSTILPLAPAVLRQPAAEPSKEIPPNTYVPRSAGPVRITGSARLGVTYYRLGEVIALIRKQAKRTLIFYASVAAVTLETHSITFTDIYTPGLPPFLTCYFFLVEAQHLHLVNTSRIVKVTAVQACEGGPQVRRMIEAQWDEVHFLAGLLYAER